MTLLNIRSLTENTFSSYYHRLQMNLQQQLDKRRQEKLRQRRELKRMRGAVEAIIDGTDSRLRSVKNYHKELGGCARNLLDHIEILVDSVPSPIVVDNNSLVLNPLVRTLLSDMEIVQRLLIRNQDVQEYFNTMDDGIRDEVYALLFIRHREKTILGSELRGDIILREVKQTCLGFYGHRLVGPSPSEQDVRFELLVTLFESVVRYIKDLFLEEKKQLINRSKNSVVVRPDQSIINPTVYLYKLIERLSSPSQLIKLQQNEVRVSKMGIKMQNETSIPSDLLKFHELQIGAEDSCIVSIIRYPRDGLSVQARSGISFID